MRYNYNCVLKGGGMNKTLKNDMPAYLVVESALIIFI